jgi:L-ascorbate metabolism protein UlaG (beta-lactamase superfamily)
VLRWQFGPDRKRHPWPDWAPSPFADTPPAQVNGDKARLSYVGHASWLIQTAGMNILIDPVWSDRVSPVSFAGPKRHNAPGIAFEALPRIDLVLVSHGHGAYEPRWFMRDQHMNPDDAVKALTDCGAAQALAHHYGTFQLTDEAIDAPVIALHAALDDARIPRQRFAALKPGQVVEI